MIENFPVQANVNYRIIGLIVRAPQVAGRCCVCLDITLRWLH
jgi:hypothetical protein